MAILRLRLIDRYLLRSLAPPLAAAFTVVLISLLLYRILDIFNMLASSNAQFTMVARLIGGLLPHYLGLALPAGYFIAMFVVVTRMSDTSEVDALLASGMSIERLTLPFLGVGALVAAASLILLGYVQPHGRYDYNAGVDAAKAAGWNARLQPRTFVGAGDQFVISADRSDQSGRRLTGVFVRRVNAEGVEQIFTAASGELVASQDGRRTTLILIQGRQVQDRPSGPVVGAFERFEIDAPTAPPSLFRPRGPAPRELTMTELARAIPKTPIGKVLRGLEAELHSRSVRAISPLLLPLLAVPLAMAAKRNRRSAGFIVAAVVLLLYEYAIDGAQSVAQLGAISPVVAIWSPFIVFAGICGGLFLSSRHRPGSNLLNSLVDALDGLMSVLARRLKRRP